MAAVSASLVSTSLAAAAPASLKSEFSGAQVIGVPSLSSKPASRSLRVEASGGKKISTKTPLGPSGDTKYKGGLDASGSKAKGKGVYQFTKKYGANVDGYRVEILWVLALSAIDPKRACGSPIYAPEEWSAGGDTYAAGPTGLALWAVTLGAVLLGGALLVYNTSALSQ